MASSSTSGTAVAMDNKKTDRMNKLRELQMRRNEARKLNHQAVVEEDRQKKLPKNFESKRARIEWEEEDEKKRKECEERGEDYDRVKLLTVGADEAERWERKKKKKNPDVGFSDYAAASARQYNSLTKQIKPNMANYNEEKEKAGDRFFPTTSTLTDERKDSSDAVDRMVQDLEKQIDKRSKYSRRRVFDEEEDIDYINERNMKFNKKLDRFYGKYTTEIKQNLERGTAV